MSDEYRYFIRELKRHMMEQKLTPTDVAGMVRVRFSTVYNWLNFRTIMNGSDMLQIIDKIMDGRIG